MSNPVKPTIKTEIIPIIFITLSVLASFYFYANFPETVPTHWNFRGEVDGWSNKSFAAFFFPGVILGIYLLFFIFPFLDPNKDRYVQFIKPFHLFKGFIVVFFTGIYFIASYAGLGHNLDMGRILPATIGILFIALGNYMGKIKRNWFMGIRTPWTISNEEVWNKTHRLGGKMFTLAGILMALGIFMPQNVFWVLFTVVITAILLVPMVYSYIIFSKLEKQK